MLFVQYTYMYIDMCVGISHNKTSSTTLGWVIFVSAIVPFAMSDEVFRLALSLFELSGFQRGLPAQGALVGGGGIDDPPDETLGAWGGIGVLADIIGASLEGGCGDLIGKPPLAIGGALLGLGTAVPGAGPGAAAVPTLEFDRVVDWLAQGALVPSRGGPRAEASSSDKAGPSLMGWFDVCIDTGAGVAVGS